MTGGGSERENKAAEPVPFAVFECSTAKMDAVNRRLWLAVLALIAALVITNIAWLRAWMSYDYVSETVTVDSTAGHANYIRDGGTVYNGQDYGQAQDENP